MKKDENNRENYENLVHQHPGLIVHLLNQPLVITQMFVTQLKDFSLAWCLKNENVHCVLLGASSVEQLYENINSLHVILFDHLSIRQTFFLLKIVSKLTPAIMADIDRILGNKPIVRLSTKSEVNIQTPIQLPQAQR